MADGSLWADAERARRTVAEVKSLKGWLEPYHALRKRVDEGRLVVTVMMLAVIARGLVCARAVVHEGLQASAENLAEVAFKGLKRGRSVGHASIINECVFAS